MLTRYEQKSVRLTAAVHNALRVEISKACCGAAQLNHGE